MTSPISWRMTSSPGQWYYPRPNPYGYYRPFSGLHSYYRHHQGIFGKENYSSESSLQRLSSAERHRQRHLLGRKICFMMTAIALAVIATSVVIIVLFACKFVLFRKTSSVIKLYQHSQRKHLNLFVPLLLLASSGGSNGNNSRNNTQNSKLT